MGNSRIVKKLSLSNLQLIIAKPKTQKVLISLHDHSSASPEQQNQTNPKY